jgi:hypothetical protein
MIKLFKWLFRGSDADFGPAALPYGEGKTTVINGDIYSPAANIPEFRSEADNVINVSPVIPATRPVKAKTASKKLGVKPKAKTKTRAQASARA